MAVRRFLQLPHEKKRVASYWLLTLSFLLLMPNFALLAEVTFNQPLLTFGERIGFVGEIYANTLRYLLEPIILSTIILSLLLALNFALIAYVRKKNKNVGGSLNDTLTMLVSSQYVAGGASLLATLVSLVGGTGGTFIGGSFSRLQTLIVILNTAAILIALRSIYKVVPTIIRLTTELNVGILTVKEAA